MIASLLIANRGEIACRVMRTARRLGVRTIAVYSDADAKALHVRMADEAVHIGASPARESYLCGDRIIEAAKESGAEGIHPGYGFLAENADFAQAVIDAGLIWVGPKPDSIRAMGLKDAAKKLMAEAGVPVTPGYLGEDQSPKHLKKEADAIGYPVLIKAVAGGGGKGMRKVDVGADFEDALESCKREASSSFGNDIVLLEKWIESPRHIEVQVFGDSHGNVVHLFERDCSLQRRHQKVIEEAPAPCMDAETREAVCGAAVRAAQAVSYEGAGTIEFIADASEGLRGDRIWFMEMNTRLQVEHPVTEEITGQDLVEWQLRVASGEPLPKTQDELAITGHAIEARLYAEEPAKGFLPSVGKLDHFDLGDEGRIETGVEEGDAISSFYDPMIAKLIGRGADRDEAIGELASMLDNVEVWPVRTNAGFLFNAVLHPEFGAADIDTGFIERNLDALVPDPEPEEAIWRGAAAVALAVDEDEEPLAGLAGFRLNAPVQDRVSLSRRSEVRWVSTADGEFAAVSGFRDEERVVAFYEGQAYEFGLTVRGTGASHGVHDGELEAPMPGKVTAVEVSHGEKVAKGQRLLTLEAMKMEHALTAPFDGTVAELNAKAGAQVTEGQLLVRVEAEPTSD
ncbi:acetyl/propionyl/methylcrotonyl-CoA carboxylase subunit alpha [Sphingomonas segetis]|uniref:acetyl/propionyl/methylcrotonyl-CoA carboxylase subunit alpha n=1 Tax=Sphingomonas segetis TaxID=1104779 RepID=UPI0012D357FD|nr:acetyl/propionyl/methylcrotonyl-CoA carboxylase subunit alpha [Sphingomonas segetis]